MTSTPLLSWYARGLTAAAFVATAAAGAHAQTSFYNEVAQEGRIYVFAIPSRYDAFTRTNGVQIGPVIERPDYGPDGETVVFDSQDAINLYNSRHGLAIESVQQTPDYPSSKISGLMLGDSSYFAE